MESTSRANCWAEREVVPLKTMCSTKWEMPLSVEGLVARAGVDPDAHGDGADVGDGLGEDEQAVGQDGAADVAGVAGWDVGSGCGHAASYLRVASTSFHGGGAARRVAARSGTAGGRYRTRVAVSKLEMMVAADAARALFGMDRRRSCAR